MVQTLKMGKFCTLVSHRIDFPQNLSYSFFLFKTNFQVNAFTHIHYEAEEVEGKSIKDIRKEKEVAY